MSGVSGNTALRTADSRRLNRGADHQPRSSAPHNAGSQISKSSELRARTGNAHGATSVAVPTRLNAASASPARPSHTPRAERVSSGNDAAVMSTALAAALSASVYGATASSDDTVMGSPPASAI